MGQQILFYMLREDRDTFLDFIQKRDPVVVTQMISNSAEVLPVTHLDLDRGGFFCFWNEKLLPQLRRKWITEAKSYRVDDFELPVLEFSTSFRAVWNRRPALGQGRIYGSFEGKRREFERWYEALVRWIRKNFRKSPAAFGGYVGPTAYEWYKKGGYLLPGFLPPKTKEWLKEIGKQH